MLRPIMPLPTSFLEELRARLPVSHVVGRVVRLIRAGPSEFKGLCPFHKEKTPSFTVNDDKGFFHCFGCGAHGDAIGFLMQHDGLDFRAGVERLAWWVGPPVPRAHHFGPLQVPVMSKENRDIRRALPSPPPSLERYNTLDGKTFLICVGAMRCATSWLYHYLGALPDVTVSALKELHFFSAKFPEKALNDMDAFALKRLGFHLGQAGGGVDDLAGQPTFRASVDRVQMIYDDDAYFGHFARICGPGTRTFCDITPAYAVIGRDGFAYLKGFCASQDVSLKILFIMRDPVDRLWSQLRYLQQINPNTDILAKWREAIQSPRVMARADYRGTVGDLDRVFPSANILYLFYEDLFSDEALRRLCRFADVGFRPGDPGDAKNQAALRMALPEDVRATLGTVLAPQYDFCRHHFGSAVPATWRS